MFSSTTIYMQKIYEDKILSSPPTNMIRSLKKI